MDSPFPPDPPEGTPHEEVSPEAALPPIALPQAEAELRGEAASQAPDSVNADNEVRVGPNPSSSEGIGPQAISPSRSECSRSGSPHDFSDRTGSHANRAATICRPQHGPRRVRDHSDSSRPVLPLGNPPGFDFGCHVAQDDGRHDARRQLCAHNRDLRDACGGVDYVGRGIDPCPALGLGDHVDRVVGGTPRGHFDDHLSDGGHACHLYRRNENLGSQRDPDVAWRNGRRSHHNYRGGGSILGCAAGGVRHLSTVEKTCRRPASDVIRRSAGLTVVPCRSWRSACFSPMEWSITC